jgi:hypothetical protein
MTSTGLQWPKVRKEFRENLSNGSEIVTGDVDLHARAGSKFGGLMNLIYNHAPHNDVLVNDVPLIRRWSHKIIA